MFDQTATKTSGLKRKLKWALKYTVLNEKIATKNFFMIAMKNAKVIHFNVN